MRTTATGMSERQQLLNLLATKSFRLGQFRLASGATSDYYIDCRTTTLDARGGYFTGRVLLSELRKLTLPVVAVGGLTMGADPIAVSVAISSVLDGGAPVSAFLVRKSEKTHGTGRRIEGEVSAGMRVAIVDDVCTTGGSTMEAMEAAWQAQLDIAAIYCLVEREEAGGRQRLQEFWAARQPGACPFQSLFTAQEVRAAHLSLGNPQS